MTAHAPGGRILVVDDERLNRMLLERALREQGHEPCMAGNGIEALERLRAEPIDMVLLDLLMPEMDGFDTLAAIKADPDLAHLPVIVISGLDELSGVVRCIEMGATDFLPKPFEGRILRARVEAGLAAKRLRDLELEYLAQVASVTDAAEALERGVYQEGRLDSIARREDGLGRLARRFDEMAREVTAREARLRAQVRELRIEIDEARQATRVAEITDTDYFRTLRRRADELRRTAAGDTRPADVPAGAAEEGR